MTLAGATGLLYHRLGLLGVLRHTHHKSFIDWSFMLSSFSLLSIFSTDLAWNECRRLSFLCDL